MTVREIGSRLGTILFACTWGLFCVACGGAPADGRATGEPEASPRSVLLDPGHPEWSEEAPDTFVASVETSAGVFDIEVVRAWAPLGADRFYNLARLGYYDDARFHRVVPGFITQWGVAGDPEVTGVWYDRGMPDDPVRASNVRGSIAFAFTEPGTRSTQVYINMVDNVRLDSTGFAPFGRVVQGMDSVVDSIYSGYGERSGGGVRNGDQRRLVADGNEYLDQAFPELDRLLRIRIRQN
ncbi:MAG: peptidylprolyl isomerase [Gemmatimonadetes bacterium]|nr:peptidylprolyl isomerase [Gemmatimonadota bacterium]NNM32527.1 peptidylprolyl isomerase [Gemmatimonadota bacterium]